MNEYQRKLETLQQDFEQIQKQDKEVRVEIDNEQGIIVSCKMTNKYIVVELQDKELEKLVNEAIKEAVTQKQQLEKQKLSKLNQRTTELLQPLQDLVKGFK